MVLVLNLLTIFSFLRALQLEHAHTSPITVGHVAGFTLIGRRTTVKTILGAPLPLEEGVSVKCFNCPPRPFLGLEWDEATSLQEPSQQGSPFADVCADTC